MNPYGITKAQDLIKYGSLTRSHKVSRRSRKAARSRVRQNVRQTLKRRCCR